VLLVAASCVLAACGQGHAGSPELQAEILGDWELVEWTSNGAAIAPPEGYRATLLIDEDRLGGVSFCNTFGAGYRLHGGGLHLEGDQGGTAMGCAPDVMAAETAYVRALGAADETVAVDGGHLVLTGGGLTLRFRPVPAVPASDLVGTRWVLETVLQGDNTSSVASSTVGAPAVLTLSPDGTFTGSTGCRSLSGTWAAAAGEVRFPNMTADGECPADLAGQDAHVVQVLGDGFRAEITEDRLTATDASGLGLVYRDESG
jgi:heat shock protein HslJ